MNFFFTSRTLTTSDRWTTVHPLPTGREKTKKGSDFPNKSFLSKFLPASVKTASSFVEDSSIATTQMLPEMEINKAVIEQRVHGVHSWYSSRPTVSQLTYLSTIHPLMLPLYAPHLVSWKVFWWKVVKEWKQSRPGYIRVHRENRGQRGWRKKNRNRRSAEKEVRGKKRKIFLRPRGEPRIIFNQGRH